MPISLSVDFTMPGIQQVTRVLQKLDALWKSELSDGLKIGFFRTMVLLYGLMAWTLTQSRPAYPKMLLSALHTFCVRIFQILTGLFCGCATINQNRKVSKDNFSLIYLVHKVCELIISIIWTHYKIGTL